METITEQGYKLIDSSNDCANYAKTNDNGNITVQTLYRYGKSAIKTYTKNEFITWRTEVNTLLKGENNEI